MPRATSAEYEEVVQDAEEYEEVTGDYAPTHDFKVSPDLAGKYVGFEVKNIKGKDRVIHTFEVDGDPLSVWGAAILDSRLSGLEGQRVKVIKTGKVLTSKNGHTPHEYKVYVSKGALNRAA